MSFRQVLALLGCVVTGWMSCGSVALGLEIREIRWGFDGRVVEGCFNPVSLLVVNDHSTPFDGTLSLQRGLPSLRVDAPIRESVYLGPNQSRWIQFFPFCSRVDDSNPWIVWWGDGRREQQELPQPQRGPRGTVLLLAGGSLAQPPATAKILPDDLFPNRSTACDPLQRVVLDHEPRWSEPQQRAFLEWLQQGGELHLLQGVDGRCPQLGGVLQSLQGFAESQAVGAGRIIRHDRDLSSLSRESWQVVIAGEVAPLEEDATLPAATPGQYPNMQPFNSEDYGEYDPGEMLESMRNETRTDHNWPLIHALCLLYIALIFPGGWVVSRLRPGDYRIVFGGLLGVVTVFSLLLLIVGRRGAGEVESINTLLLARPLDDERVSVSGWAGAFVARGGVYTIEHAGQGGLYTSGQQFEAVQGWIAPQGPPRLEVDLPPFSSRSFIHRVNSSDRLGRWQVTDLEMGMTDVELPLLVTDILQGKNLAMRRTQVSSLTKLTIRQGPAGTTSTPKRIMVVFGPLVYSLTQVTEGGPEWSLPPQVPSPVLNKVQSQTANTFGMGVTWGGSMPKVPPGAIYREAPEELLRQALRLPDSDAAVDFRLPDGRLCVLAWYPLPGELRVTGDSFATQRGGCLLVQDLSLEEAL